jgi:hypothetical protein
MHVCNGKGGREENPAPNKNKKYSEGSKYKNNAETHGSS